MTQPFSSTILITLNHAPYPATWHYFSHGTTDGDDNDIVIDNRIAAVDVQNTPT